MLKAKNAVEPAAEPHEAFAVMLRKNAPFPASAPRNDPAVLGPAIFQFVSQSLVGPFGLHPETLFAALGALAGYAAKWAVAVDAAEGLCPNDFRFEKAAWGGTLVFSDQVLKLVGGRSGESVLSIVLAAAARNGGNSLSVLEDLSGRIILPGPVNAMPDYSVGEAHYPQFAPEALLLMLWENVSRFFKHDGGGRQTIALAAAYAGAYAVSTYRDRYKAEVSAALIIETAMAMSKIDRAF
ncbi:MAG: hypothetical protein WAT78_00030 [Rhizobiaceae bacterium]